MIELVSVNKIESIAESEKNRIGKILDGNSIFDDEKVVDVFLAKRRKEIELASTSWIKNQEKALETCKNTQDVNRVIFTLDSPPSYSEGLINEETDRIRTGAKELISSMKLDYIKGLFEELSFKERKMFIDWSNKK